MGLDLGDDMKTRSEPGESLRDIVESAVQSALRTNRNRVTFSFNPAAVKADDLAEVCADLQKQYPGLKEIVPSRVDGNAIAYLNEKPGKAKKFLLSFTTAEL
jgi:hypothetical protein